MKKLNLSVIKGFLTTFKRPLVVAIELTNDCNANCSMCIRTRLSREVTYIDDQLFKKIIHDARKIGVKIFQLSFYGESMLDPALADKVRFIKDSIPDAWIQIVTNGSLLTEEESRRLLDAGISEIRISIEGNNKAEFEQIRLGLNYDQVLSNLEYLKKLRDSNENYNTQIVITGLNLKALPLDGQKYKEFWQAYADIVYTRDEHILDFEKQERFLRKILPCHQLFTILLILADGRYPICTYDWYAKTVYGNIKNTTINQAWFAPRFLFYKLLHLAGLKKSITLCRNCSYRPNYRRIFA